MKTRTFYLPLKVKHIALLICCLISVLNLPHCTSQEKKIKTKVKTEIKDSLTQKINIATNVDTTKGVFLIYKFGDSENVVNSKTWYLVKNNELSKEAEYDDILKTYNNLFFYNLFIDPKYSTGAVGYYAGDEFVPEDCYLKFKLSFEFAYDKLFKIILYYGISDDERINTKENWRNYWQAYTPQNTQATLDVYSKKYKGWYKRKNEYGLVEFLHKNGNVNITIQNNYYSVNVIYTDINLEFRLKNQEKESLKIKMREKNKGI